MKLSGLYYGYWLVGAAFVAQFIAIGMYSYVLGPFMTPMTEELGWSRADFTLTRSIGQIVMALLGIYIGARVDRIGGRPIMFVGTTVLTITLILHQYVETLWGWWILNGVSWHKPVGLPRSSLRGLWHLPCFLTRAWTA